MTPDARGARGEAADNALGAFLRARRDAISPSPLGIPDDGRMRRVPGLRREELAALAHVSVDYLVRLEQGRSRRVSSSVLQLLADALELTADERTHLFRLADVAQPTSSRMLREQEQKVPQQITQLLAGLHDVPALALGRCLDVLAWNPLAAALLVDFGQLPPRQRNLVRLIFLNPAYRALFADAWEPVARESVAALRMEAGRRPDDIDLAALVDELAAVDPDFQVWWSSHRVGGARLRRKTYHHPLVGPLTLDVQQLTVNGEPDQQVVTYTAQPDSPSQAALHFLARWTADPGGIQNAPRNQQT